MMRNFAYILLFLCSFSAVKAQNIASLFSNMPDEHIPQLESAWRKDLIDLYNSGKEATLKNSMEGTSKLLKLTDNYLLLQVTERSTQEMKLLPLINNTNIICLVTTVNGPVADSRVDFFTTDWHPLATEGLLSPVTTEWFLKEDADKTSDSYKDAVSRLDMELIKYNLNADDLTLTATYTTPLYLSREERDKVSVFLKDAPKVYTWDRTRFN